jgi:hypothetical protein
MGGLILWSQSYPRGNGARNKTRVRPEGFEPPTFRSVAGRSNPLSYGRNKARVTGGLLGAGAEAQGFEPWKGLYTP